MPYERALRIPVSIADVAIEGNLDTGADVGIVLPQALYDTLEAAPLLPSGRATLAYGGIEITRARMAGPFRLGGLTLTDVEVRVSERFPELLIGTHALQGTTLLIDQRSKHVAICPQAM